MIERYYVYILVLLCACFVRAEILTNCVSGVFLCFESSPELVILLSASKDSRRDAVDLCDVILPTKVRDVFLRRIGDRAFSGLLWLRRLEIAPSVSRIGSGAFSDCSNLVSVVVSAGEGRSCRLNSLGDGCFSRCVSLKEVILPGSLSLIEHNAFEDCSALRSIKLPAGLMVVGDYAFAGCSNLDSIMLPPSLREISSDAFLDCPKLESIESESAHFEVASGVLYHLADQALVRCPPRLSADSIIVKDGTARIKAWAFEGCLKVVDVRMPGSVLAIEQLAFAGSGIRRIELSEGVKELGRWAFMKTRIFKIEIPASVEVIGEGCFKDCDQLQTIVFRGEAPRVEGNSFAPSNCVLRVDKSLPSWKGKRSFYGCRIEEIEGTRYGRILEDSKSRTLNSRLKLQ